MKCIVCEKEFERYWHDIESYKKRTFNFCSKSCKTIYQRGNFNRNDYIEKIRNFILSENRYCINMSTNTLTRHKISILDINVELGYLKPKSIFEESIYSILKTDLNFEIERQKIFNNLLSPKGYNLFFDFFINDLNLIIEADGTQHKDKNNPWYNEYCVICDNIKNEYCKNNNIKILRIPYKRQVNKQYVEKYLRVLYTTK